MMHPTLHLTETARQAVKEAALEADGGTLRLVIPPDFAYELRFDTPGPDDITVRCEDVDVLLDAESATRADGMSIDFAMGPGGAGFAIENPHAQAAATAAVRQLSARDLKAMIDSGARFEFLDVRTPGERTLACIEGTRLLDQDAAAYLMGLDRSTPLVFQCHHGMRSQSAAQHFLQLGFTQVYNLSGGIDDWSLTVDPAIPRY